MSSVKSSLEKAKESYRDDLSILSSASSLVTIVSLRRIYEVAYNFITSKVVLAVRVLFLSSKLRRDRGRLSKDYD